MKKSRGLRKVYYDNTFHININHRGGTNSMDNIPRVPN